MSVKSDWWLGVRHWSATIVQEHSRDTSSDEGSGLAKSRFSGSGTLVSSEEGSSSFSGDLECVYSYRQKDTWIVEKTGIRWTSKKADHKVKFGCELTIRQNQEGEAVYAFQIYSLADENYDTYGEFVWFGVGEDHAVVEEELFSIGPPYHDQAQGGATPLNLLPVPEERASLMFTETGSEGADSWITRWTFVPDGASQVTPAPPPPPLPPPPIPPAPPSAPIAKPEPAKKRAPKPRRPAEIAARLLNHPNVKFAAGHVSGIKDQATPRDNLAQVAAGAKAQRSNYQSDSRYPRAPGGKVDLDARMLSALEALAEKYSFRITELAGAQHSGGSRHYGGRAFDIDLLNGRGIAGNPSWREFLKDAGALGANQLLGPGFTGHSTHLHVGWPAPVRANGTEALDQIIDEEHPRCAHSLSEAEPGGRSKSETSSLSAGDAAFLEEALHSLDLLGGQMRLKGQARAATSEELLRIWSESDRDLRKQFRARVKEASREAKFRTGVNALPNQTHKLPEHPILIIDAAVGWIDLDFHTRPLR